MKMKAIVGSIAIAVMLSGVMVGCAAQPKEGVYKQVSVRTMTVSIPTDWQKAGGEAIEAGTIVAPEVCTMDGYYDKTRSAVLVVVLWDYKQYLKSKNLSWEGWEALEAEGMTKEDWVESMATGFIGQVEQLARKVHRQLTIDGKEAWEQQYTGKMHDEPYSIAVVCVFSEDDIGILMMTVEETKWGRFEGTWGKIRDSVKLAPKT